MQQNDDPEHYADENSPTAGLTSHITKQTVRINQKYKESLIQHRQKSYPQTLQGHEQWESDQTDLLSVRERLFQEVKNFEDFAQTIAYENGCESTSTLDKLNGRDAGLAGEKGGKLHLAYRIERRVEKIREEISNFERHNSDEGDRHRFYIAMNDALSIAEDYHLMTIKQYEKQILRGSDDSFNHKGKGTPTAKQIEAVRKVQTLIGNGHTQNTAADIVGKEYGRAASTVKGWIKNHK